MHFTVRHDMNFYSLNWVDSSKSWRWSCPYA